MTRVSLRKVTGAERAVFITGAQQAFQQGFEDEFGPRREPILPARDIEESFSRSGSQAYFAMIDEEIVGGVLVVTDAGSARGSLDFIFVNVRAQDRGIGQQTWELIEEEYPQIDVWDTYTPYFEKRNIHFYVNRLGFHITEFFNKNHPDPHHSDERDGGMPEDIAQDFFRFEKHCNQSRRV